jgi:hypothetical protein
MTWTWRRPGACADLRTLTGPASDPPVALAVAVNGIIEAVRITFSKEGAPQTFAMVVPGLLLQPGTNRIRVYQVERTLRRGSTVVVAA